MKKVMSVLALLAFVGTANAELLKNFKYDGKIEVNAYNTNNQDFNKKANDKSGFVDTRVLLNAGFDLNDDVSAVVTAVKNNRQYGQNEETMTANTGVKANDGVLGNVWFEQAYLNLKGVLGIDHKLGRQFYGEAGDMVIYYGPKMWPYNATLPVTAIDGWTGAYKYGNWDFGAIIAKPMQSAASAGKQDINLSGFNAMTKVADVNLHGYVYQNVDNKTSAGNADYLDVVGLKAKYAVPQVKNLNVAGEYAMNMGKMTNGGLKHKGFAYKANADYSMDLMGKLGFDGEYYFATGDNNGADKSDKAFKAIASDYRPGVIMGGGFTAGITGTSSGNTTIGVGANWTPEKLNKLNVAVKYYDFSADKKGNLVKAHIGTEYDAVATWMHSDNVNVKGYYAMFQNEKKNLATDDAETMMGAAVNVKF